MSPDHLSLPSKIFLYAVILFWSCASDPNERPESPGSSDQDITEFINTFEGRGDLTDDSQPTPAPEALELFQHPSDLDIDLILAEPEIFQPVEIKFDHQGRLWVVQYSQYPAPEGLRVTNVDNHLRTQYDKVPDPPPGGMKGADKITFFEDTDHDGLFDRATDAITGLNIATSVLPGRGKIWVLNPPYLLAYPDPDGDGIPDGDPEICLKGFGLEDTHAVANSLTWGPDGWIYGAQGSTCTADISSRATQHVQFEGQAIWRFHPITEVFEIFAEGGGNTFDIEIDAKGRLYSGHNGAERGQYYKQGGYYTKNWGKHGPHTNPYSYGFIPNMELDGDRKRFTHAWIKYEGATLPSKYQDKMLAINPLHSYLQLTRFEPYGSTFRNIDEEKILETPDTWFRPVDIKAGPDGNVYLADWYDSRLSHVDPRDTWHKKSGRVYRLRNTNWSPGAPLDMSTWSDRQLIDSLSSPNKWIRQHVQQILADRQDSRYLTLLYPLIEGDEGQAALEALWAIYSCKGFNESLSLEALQHADPYVRMWAIRLLGDSDRLTPEQSRSLAELARSENHPEVRSQLAATAKRIKAEDALPIIQGLLLQREDAADPDIPHQIWWALEAKMQIDPAVVNTVFKSAAYWKTPMAQEKILSNAGQRLISTALPEDYSALIDLLALAPGVKEAKPLVTGILDGLRGRSLNSLPTAMYQALKPFSEVMGEGKLTASIRAGDTTSMGEALEIIKNPEAGLQDRLAYTKIFAEINYPQAVSVLLDMVDHQNTPLSLKHAAIRTLRNYPDEEIGERISNAYPDRLRADPDMRLAALSLLMTRPAWTTKLLNMVTGTRQIHKEDIPSYMVMELSLSDHPQIRDRIHTIWPEVQSMEENAKSQQYEDILALLDQTPGDANSGRNIYENKCSTCHRLGDLGKNIGPDLTSYDRKNNKDLLYNIIFPNADIREGYVNFIVNTKNDRTFVGTLHNDQGNIIQLRTADGETITLSKSEIAEMEALDRSLMPEGLLTGLTQKEIINLFTFLKEEP
ncbi:MAG: HEAT repeat domain-containing protein [Saprospiraceae bacterium]|nr:HEAT repeat domain-containing protein [Saprospiraceae bacterium]